ncbi:hypothetical protein WJX75_001359 [Coccomyxa subellipsoidea]|uniref:Uncharacterized protein n=1 Tax=Coccomyxa subellipsoidea TaxID=248742 RepID=A0ABR2YML9_9CHLO
MLLYHHGQTSLAGSQGLRQASATYMPPPQQQTAPIFSSDRIDRTVERLEPTVPLLHQAHAANHLLASAIQEAHVQAAKSCPILRPAHGRGYAVGEVLAPSGGGSMPLQPSQTSIRALLASQSLSKRNNSGGADARSTFPGFSLRPQSSFETGDVPRIDSGVSLDSLSLTDAGRG